MTRMCSRLGASRYSPESTSCGTSRKSISRGDRKLRLNSRFVFCERCRYPAWQKTKAYALTPITLQIIWPEFFAAPLADAAPAQGRLMLGTVRSHDQWNTTIYSDDDRYRGVKNLRTLIFMNEEDMRERGLGKYDLIDVTSFAKDGSTRSVRGYRAIPYNLPRGSTMGYMPELNVLCAIGDFLGSAGS